jgi:glycosyltransferase involved in cell wall biosynthesis
MKDKIGFIAPFLTHYRVNFYKKLQNSLGEEIIFFFQQKHENDGRPGIEFRENNSFRSYSNIFLSIGSVKPQFSLDLIRKVRENNVKILILEGASSNITSWYFILFRKLLKIKIIIWACGWHPEIHSWFIRKVKRLLEKTFFNNADWIITYSTTAEKFLKQLGIKTRITVAYNGIDLDNYQINGLVVLEKAELLKNGTKNKIFLYVGGIFRDKMVHFLIDGFFEFIKIIPDSVLWIIGDGPDMENIERLVSEKNLGNIILWGRKESDVDQYFAAADFFILPGVGGLAVNQAMMWGTPCIVSEADGTENDLVLEGQTGFRFEKNDKNSLIKALNRAVSLDQQQKQEMSFNAQKLILTRSNTNKMVEIFTEIINNLNLEHKV